ncbi:MAG: hypothetical protein RSB82_00420 [Victivallaceae bacterium]
MTSEPPSYKDIFHSSHSGKMLSEIENLLIYQDTNLYAEGNLCYFQDRFLIKNAFVARELAKLLITEAGELNKPGLTEAVSFLEAHLYPLSENETNETTQRLHLFKSLKALKEKEITEQILKKIFCPSHTKIHQLIRETLFLDERTTVTVQHVRQAALSALFSYLRQDVGSCFITAPAIIIQEQYPELFLQDIEKLISTAKLTKLYEHQQITVPINLTGGLGSLRKPVEIYRMFPANPITIISQEPGILKAFEAAGIIPVNHPDPSSICQEILANRYIEDILKNPYALISAEQIIKYTLLHIYEINEEDVETHSFLEGIKPVEEIATVGSSSGLSKISKINTFITKFRLAKTAFIRLTVNPLLKSWELSLASLAETKANFSTHHILIGLGMYPQEPNGIASYLQTAIHEEMFAVQDEAEACESRYRHVQADLNYIENRLRLPLNQRDAEALSIDLHLKRQELNRALYEWDNCREKQQHLINLIPELLKIYTTYISQYFHGLYDATMNDVSQEAHQDRPAGFRIYYTHGRNNSLSWSSINSLQEYIYSLTQFLSLTEVDIMEKQRYANLKKEISRCIGKLITAIHTDDFQEAAFSRILAYYHIIAPNKPLEHINELPYKPWAYISGGTVESFLCTYFDLNQDPNKIFKHPENPAELAAFFSDSTKDLPGVAIDYLKQSDARFLASSPTHVFSVMPGNSLFRDSWDNNWYSYSWIRDVWGQQHVDFFSQTLLTKQQLPRLLEECIQLFPPYLVSLRDLLHFFGDLSLTITEFYEKMERFLQNQAQISSLKFLDKLKADIAGIIFSCTPLFSEQRLPQLIDDISRYIGVVSKINFKNSADIIEKNVPKYSTLTPKDFRTLYKMLAIHHYGKLYVEEDFHLRLVTAMRHYKIAYPAPLIIGDSNWEHIFFGFTIHPATQQTDFWTFDYSGVNGKPMIDWKKYFSTEQQWSLFNDPRQYGFGLDFIENDANLRFF